MKSILTKICVASIFLALDAGAECFVANGERKIPFEGKSFKNLKVEKKSLLLLNKEFPAMNVLESTFKGDLQTCSSCEGRYITCTQEEQ